MRTVHESALMAELAFAREAAAAFAASPELHSYTDGEIKPEALLALRWGLGRDCVLVLKLDWQHTPTIYAQQIRT